MIKHNIILIKALSDETGPKVNRSLTPQLDFQQLILEVELTLGDLYTYTTDYCIYCQNVWQMWFWTTVFKSSFLLSPFAFRQWLVRTVLQLRILCCIILSYISNILIEIKKKKILTSFLQTRMFSLITLFVSVDFFVNKQLHFLENCNKNVYSKSIPYNNFNWFINCARLKNCPLHTISLKMKC